MSGEATRESLTARLQGDRQLERVYGQYHEFVRRALRKHHVNQSDIDDMTQEVFLVLVRKVDEVAAPRALGGWLYQIARRVAANHHRAEQRRSRKHQALGRESVAAPEDPEALVARQQAWAEVRSFLESLDEEACAVFVMSEIEGLKGAEVAARLGLTLPMTYARIRNVRARFATQVARPQRALVPAVFAGNAQGTAASDLVFLSSSWSSKVGLAVVVLALLWLGSSVLGYRGGASGPAAAPHSDVEGDDKDDPRHAAPKTGEDHAREPWPTAQPLGTFSGVVVSEAGEPIEGASVCAGRMSDNDHWLVQAPPCTLSDNEGRFEVPGGSIRVHTLMVMAEGYLPGRFHGLPRAELRLVLGAGGQPLRGTVKDVYGGPIAGAWVSLENRDDQSLGATVRTDEQGHFRLWAPAGPVSLGSGAEGYATAFRMAHAPSEDLVIELAPESAIAGIVVDSESGTAVAGVRVTAELLPGADKYANRAGIAYSDADGHFEILGLQPNHYGLDAVGDASWGRPQGMINLGIADRRDDVRIEMFSGFEVDARIVDAQSGAACTEGIAATLDDAQSIFRGGRVASDGRLTIPALTGGVVYQVEVTCVGYAKDHVELDLRAGAVGLQTWALSKGSSVSVTVRDAEGNPVRGARIEITQRLSERDTLPIQQDQWSDGEGLAQFSGLVPGSHQLTVRGEGQAQREHRSITVAPGNNAVQVVLNPGVRVSGQVRRGGGEPAPGALVMLRSQDDQATVGPYQALTTPHGSFAIADVPPGNYGVWVVPGRHAHPFMRPNDLQSTSLPSVGTPQRNISVSGDPVELDLSLDALLSISGVVRTLDGDFVPDARVFAARGKGDRRYDPTGQPSLSDREGRFSISELAPGPYALTAYRREGGAVREFGVQAGSAGVNLVFPDTARVEGHVTYAKDKQPVVAFRLVVEGPDGYTDPFVPVGSRDGHFVINDLPPATYTLRAIAPQGVAETQVRLGPGEARTDVKLTIQARAKISGRLVDEKGNARGRWIVALIDANSLQPLSKRPIHGQVTDTRGRFELNHLGAAEYVMLAMPAPPQDPGPEAVAAAPEVKKVSLEEGQQLELGDVVAMSPPPSG